MDFQKTMLEKAKSMQKRLVLAEGNEPRTVAAARKIVDGNYAKEVTLIGKIADIEKTAREAGVKLDGITLVDPEKSPLLEKYSAAYYDAKHKHDEAKAAAGKPVAHPYTPESARAQLLDPMHWGGMMVHLGDADAMVAGALAPTANMIKAGLDTVGTTSKTASSCFVVVCQDKSWGVDGALIFSDCAVIPEPTAEQLPDIAISAAASCRAFLGVEPVVAMLSFSTKGSADAKFKDVGNVQQAVELLKQRKPDFAFDGEFQADAALVPKVTDQKAPGSPIRGKVNTLIFPNLAAGNIGYKLVQRLGNAEAFGPFLQGFKKPISDLSRGCSVDDIVVTSAVTMAQCQ
jgi:phosphate acetyltransferase